MNADIALERYDALDAALVAAGFPRTSAWWRATIGRFLERGVRQLVARVGRRGGKSSTLCRLAVVLALYGGHAIPPGDVGVVAFISTRHYEALERLRTIEAILTAIRVKYRRSDDKIELVDKPIVFRTFTASVAGVSGPTCIVVIADEVAKWRDADTGANPATEVLASVRPTMATQPNARMVLSSSPLSTQDAHYEAFERGDTADQVVAEAPTWTANPTVTEAETRRLEPDDRVWRREYAAIPQASALSAFDGDAVERAFREPPRSVPFRRTIVLDPSSGRKDAWTWGVCGWNLPEGEPFLLFETIGAVTGSFWRKVSGEEIVDDVAKLATEREIGLVHADQRESLMLAAAFERKGLGYCVHDWTNPSKVEAVARVRRWFAEGSIILPPECTQLRRELAAFEEVVTPSGAFTFKARGSGHDDFVALLLTAAMVDAAGEMPVRRAGQSFGELAWSSSEQSFNDNSRAW